MPVIMRSTQTKPLPGCIHDREFIDQDNKKPSELHCLRSLSLSLARSLALKKRTYGNQFMGWKRNRFFSCDEGKTRFENWQNQQIEGKLKTGNPPKLFISNLSPLEQPSPLNQHWYFWKRALWSFNSSKHNVLGSVEVRVRLGQYESRPVKTPHLHSPVPSPV